MSDAVKENNTQGKRKGMWKYALYIFIVLAATAISLASSLWGRFNEVLSAIGAADYRWVLGFIGVQVGMYVLAGLIIKIFVRLYTRRYPIYRGMAVALIGDFYSNVTPSASGGQIMQVYTLKKQGVQVSNAASIMVMWFILYQVALILVGVASLIFKWNMVMSMTPINIFGINVPILPIVLLGFALNALVIVLLFMMSYSHRFHNFILHYGIGFLAKIRIVRKPDKARENLRVQVENFKIELRRLQSNVPVTLLITTLFVVFIYIKNAMPYFSFMSIAADSYYNPTYAFNFVDFLDCGLLGSLHQMCAGIIPLPGLAGVSEYFFNVIFNDFLRDQIVFHNYLNPDGSSSIIWTSDLQNYLTNLLNASQILWRTITFHAVTLVGGLVSALYRPRSLEENAPAPSRQTFVDLQLATFDERKMSSDTMYQTTQLSRRRLLKGRAGETTEIPQYQQEGSLPEENLIAPLTIEESKKFRREKPKKEKTEKPQKQKIAKQPKPKKEKPRPEKKKVDDGDWEELSI